MKPARIAIVLWLLNAAVLAAATLLVPRTIRVASEDRVAADAPASAAGRVKWDQAAPREGAAMPEVCLSIKARPVKVIETGGPVIVAEPTDEELRAEVEAFVRKRYELQHTAIASDGSLPARAILLCARLRVQVYAGMNLQSLAGTPHAAAAADVEVKEIAADYVMLSAASQRRPQRRFDVRLDVPPTRFESAVLLQQRPEVVPGASPETWQDRLQPPPGPAPELPRLPEVTREMAEKVLDEAVKYVRVTPHGLQLTDELPQDSELYRRGARRGDLLKAVNDKPVSSLAELRKALLEQYDAGTREFKVDYERAGVPMQRKINVKSASGR